MMRMRVPVLVLLQILTTGCAIPIHNNHMRWSSDLRPIGKQTHEVEEARAHLLRVTPLGSSRTEVEATIRKEFKRGVYSVDTDNLCVTNSVVAVEALVAEDVYFLAGVWYKAAIWYFDDRGKLLDVQLVTWNCFL